MKVSEILKVKGEVLFTATPDTTLMEAVTTMSLHDMGSLVIMEHGDLVGMLTFREIIRHAAANGGTLGDTRLRAVMDDAPVTISPGTELNEARRLMLDKHARYIPVMEGKTLLGIISFYDVARAVLDAQGFENRMLKAYIRDWPDVPADEAS